jgi:hypothetical protein
MEVQVPTENNLRGLHGCTKQFLHPPKAIDAKQCFAAQNIQ